MKILSIETSCDETAIAVLACSGDDTTADFHVLSHALISQIEIHRKYGGVFPAVAKREHAKNLVPLLQSALEEAASQGEAASLGEITQADMRYEHTDREKLPHDIHTKIGELLAREADLAEAFFAFIDETERPEIDAIAVTYGPGLEPALWVGVNFAQALALAWNLPLVPVNHMEGHLMISLAQPSAEESDGLHLTISDVTLPVLALLISGGHTEIDVMEESLSYTLLGQTRDDAVGEAFDKVARMMDLPYPGGPEISVLAEKAREDGSENQFALPRPMIDSPDYDFSFSGLKTAVLYMIRDTPSLQPAPEGAIADTRVKEQLARAFEDAAADVLVAKVSRALEDTQAQTLAIGGGVSANAHIRRAFEKNIAEKFPYVDLRFPPAGLTGDNAVMIGIAGYYHFLRNEFTEPGTLTANGNLSLSKKFL